MKKILENVLYKTAPKNFERIFSVLFCLLFSILFIHTSKLVILKLLIVSISISSFSLPSLLTNYKTSGRRFCEGRNSGRPYTSRFGQHILRFCAKICCPFFASLRFSSFSYLAFFSPSTYIDISHSCHVLEVMMPVVCTVMGCLGWPENAVCHRGILISTKMIPLLIGKTTVYC